METCCVFHWLFFVCLNTRPPQASTVLDWMESRSLSGLENVSRASSDIVASGKWVQFQFWVNFPFKLTEQLQPFRLTPGGGG